MNGAVGFTMPNRTGATSDSAVSHNSRNEIVSRAWKTFLHRLIGNMADNPWLLMMEEKKGYKLSG
jgi:hypothetical protein